MQEKNVRIWDGNSSRAFLDAAGLGHHEEGDLGPVYGFQWRHFGAEYKDMHSDYSGQGKILHATLLAPIGRVVYFKSSRECNLPSTTLLLNYFLGFDQLADVIDKIRNRPDDRRIIMCAGNPPDIKNMALPPCHCLVQFYVANGELSCQLYQRSADIGLGKISNNIKV